jgi:16S rRNA (adenine1518-N6/adenine1519-N6)-dimethyltransferase
MNLPSTSEFIKKYQLDAKKSLGQNFILDKNFTDKIVKSAGDLNDQYILEIGPGPGSLTRSILDHDIKKLIVVEKDQRCLNILQEIKQFHSKLEIIAQDALDINEADLFKENKFKIIANLPYNIATILIFKWLRILQNITSMTLMVQKEVAQRITAKVGDKNYGRLSVMINYLCHSKINFIVSNSVFKPRPKVMSAIIELKPKVNEINLAEFKRLENITAIAFNQRRKMLKKSLQRSFKEPSLILEKLNIDDKLRPEDLTIEQFVKIANYRE